MCPDQRCTTTPITVKVMRGRGGIIVSYKLFLLLLIESCSFYFDEVMNERELTVAVAIAVVFAVAVVPAAV